MTKSILRFLFINYLKILTSFKLTFRFKGRIIGVAGCYGKTSAVGLIENLLKQQYKVFSTNLAGKGLNSETGIPFAILGVKIHGYSYLNWVEYFFKANLGAFRKLRYDFLVLEMGVDKPDDMKFLTSFIKPDIGILINSNNSHSANFEHIQILTNKSYEELISDENGYIFERAKEAILYNLDDPEVVRQIDRFQGQTKLPFSLTRDNKVQSFEPSLEWTVITFPYEGNKVTVRHSEPLLEEYRVTLEMVIRLAEFLNVSGEKLLRAIESYVLPPGRCSLFKGIQNSFILDSTYNSAFMPANAAIRLARDISRQRALGILGDMRELGTLSEKEHRKLAHIAYENFDIVITIGPLMEKFFKPEFEEINTEVKKLYSFPSTKEALDFISKDDFSLIQPFDVILVKSSQNTLFLEIIVEKLLVNEQDSSKLCRRGDYWEAQRKKLLES